MNFIFAFLILSSFSYAAVNGTLSQTFSALSDGAKNSVEICLSLAGIMSLWSGILKIAENGGALGFLKKILSPVIKRLFPNLKKESRAFSYICANLVSNLAGVGNAATPAGICAMQELDRENENPLYPSDEMCIFTILNTSSVQLIPTTVIALRSGFSSLTPEKIIIPTLISSFTALFFALLFMKITLKIRKRKI